MTRTVVFTRQTSESCSIEVEFNGDIDAAVQAAKDKLYSADPGWEPADRCYDEWDAFYVDDDVDDDDETAVRA